MDSLRLLWRCLRFALFDLPVITIFIFIVSAIAENTGFADAARIILALGFGFLAVGLYGLLRRLFAKPKNLHGSAAFARVSNLHQAGLLSWRLRRNGFILGKKNGRFIRFNKPGHLLTFAPTRSGKGVGAVIPNLLDHPGSVVVTDIKGENYHISGDYRRTLGRVAAFAPFDQGIDSAFYNPIDFIRTGTANDVDDARLISEMIVASDGQEANHWEREARVLVMGLMLFIATDLPPHRRNLREARGLLMRDQAGFDAVINAMRQSEHPTVVRVAEGFSQKEDKERSAVISTAQGCTEVFESPQLGAMTAKSTFRMEDLKNGVLSLYIIVPPEYVTVYRPFLRLMVGLATAAMSRNGKLPNHNVLFLLDELPALGHMRPIEDGIGYLAGYGASLWLFVQDLDQLSQTYKKWRSLIANCAVRQAFNVQDPDTARLLSTMLGQRTVKIINHGRSGRFNLFGWANSYSENTSETGRPLLAPDEVMLLPEDRELLFVQGCPPVMAEKVKYFLERRFRGRWKFWRPGAALDAQPATYELTKRRKDEISMGSETTEETSENPENPPPSFPLLPNV
jgi:type IV secretion system protein VirD4